MSKFSCPCLVSAAALPCAFLRLRKRSQSEGRAKARCVEWCDKMWCDNLGRLRSCLNLIDEFYYGHGRAVFSSFRLRNGVPL